MKSTNRPYYTEYVNHILRFYVRHPKTVRFRTNADKLNHRAAKKVFQRLSEPEVDILFDLYRRNDTMGDNVYEVAKTHRVSQVDIYTLITRVSNLIAKERVLI